MNLLISIDLQTEKSRRMLYLRGREVVAQRERAADMKRRNGALIYNILPPHVAAYFLSSARHHDDLYSQSYSEVGVLFASMPNFADFYSEESINNQGLECLRFLNEVISDFDAVSTIGTFLFPFEPRWNSGNSKTVENSDTFDGLGIPGSKRKSRNSF